MITRRGTEHETTPKATVSPTVRDIAWAAGFLEGEGTFAPNIRKHRKYARIAAAQCFIEPLEKLQALFGGTVTERKKTASSNPRARQMWIWNVSGPRARGIAMTLWTFLSPRRRQEIAYMFEGA